MASSPPPPPPPDVGGPVPAPPQDRPQMPGQLPPSSWPAHGPAAGAPFSGPSRRLWLRTGLALLVAGGVLGALYTVGTRTPSPGVAFTDPTSHFAASFAGTPVQDRQSLTIRDEQVPVVLWTHSLDVNVEEAVSYITYPATFDFPAPNAALDAAVTGEVTNIKGTLLSKSFGTYQGFHSVDTVASAQQGFVETRAILAGRTLFMVVVTSAQNPPELFATFASSLRIINHAP